MRGAPARNQPPRPGQRLLVPALALAAVAGCLWWGLRTPPAPAVLVPSDPVARLILESAETEFALWTERPQRLGSTLLSLLGLDRERLDAALAETELGGWFDRLDEDLKRMGVRQLAARQLTDGSWEACLEVPPMRAALLRIVGTLRRDPLLRGGRLEDSGLEVRWRRGIWTLRSAAGPGEATVGAAPTTTRTSSSPPSPFDRREAELLVRRRRTDGTSAVYGLCPARERTLGDGTTRLSAVFRRGAQCLPDEADAVEAQLDQLEASVRESARRVPDVFLVNLRGRTPDLLDTGQAGAAPARGVPADALLLLEQETLPNVTQMPSACSVAWWKEDRGLPGAQLEGVLDVRVYERRVPVSPGNGEASIRAYDRPSEAACLELHRELRRLVDGMASQEVIWIELDVFAHWLDDYVRVLDEFRVLPRRWRGASAWVEAVSGAVCPRARLLFVERQGAWYWQIVEPVDEERSEPNAGI